MKKKTLTIILIYLSIVVLSTVSVFVASRSYILYFENPDESGEVTLEHEDGDSGIIECAKTVTKNGVTKVYLSPVKQGTETLNIHMQYSGESSVVSSAVHLPITVTRTGMILVSGHDFGGYKFICLGIGMLELFSAGLLFAHFRYRQKHDFFSYRSVLELALGLYCGIRGMFHAGVFAYALLTTDIFSGLHMLEALGLMFGIIAVLSTPFVFVFSLFLSISNIALIRHEGFAFQNLLGIFISIFLGFGSIACVAIPLLYPQTILAQSENVEAAVVKTVISGVFVYFELLLFSAQFCCLYSAKREPQYNKDFIIILGCKIRKDGTPLPLLQGRIDRAIRFYKTQLAATGKQAAFIPSGGKGEDEVMPEALSVKNYLMEQGIDESLILPETKSTTTLENMRFSAQIAATRKPDAKLVFSTTNYHIFRSGILSREAGLKAAGIGAKTKWYFWPNAQIREFIGLLVHECVLNILVVLGIGAASVLFMYLTEMMERML